MNSSSKNYPDVTIEAFNEIWTQHQELQNWSSSSWWFFLLFPEQEHGYGPRQMMFTFASRAGELIRVNHDWQSGFDYNREINDRDEFMTTVVGWYHDGEKTHDEIVHQPAMAVLEGQSLSAWTINDDGQKYGASISSTDNPDELGINAYFKGKRGFADFKVWSNPDKHIGHPQISDIRSPANGKLGNTHLVAWKKLNFEGKFKYPDGVVTHKGLGYFQRVCMNVPMFPWKWIYCIFEDGSIFSTFVPYLGLQAFRRSNEFYPLWLEKLVQPFQDVSYFSSSDDKSTYYFDSCDVTPLSKSENISRIKPTVKIHAKSENGDYLKMIVQAHGNTQFILERRVLMQLWQTRYNYNEFMIKVLKFEAKINGKKLTRKTLGQGWGNMEYTWGMSL